MSIHFHEEYQYLNALKEASEGAIKVGRNGNTFGFAGNMMKFKLHRLTEGPMSKTIQRVVPLMTTKNVLHRFIIEELLFFIKGNTDTKILDKQGVRIWNGNTSRATLDAMGFTNREEGDMGPCFVKGTPILTNTGYKNIEDVRIGDLVYTHKNRYRPVVDTQKNTSNEIYYINCHNLPTAIGCTDNHPFLVRDGETNKLVFKRADTLTLADKLTMPINTDKIIPDVLNVGKTDQTDKDLLSTYENLINSLVSTAESNENPAEIVKERADIFDVLMILGYAFNFGSIIFANREVNNKIHIKCQSLRFSDKSKLPLVACINILNLKSVSASTKVKTYIMYDNKYYQLFYDVIKLAKENKLPNWLLHLPEDYLFEFMRGFMFPKDRVYYASNYALQLKLQLIMIKIGGLAEITAYNNAFMFTDYAIYMRKVVPDHTYADVAITNIQKIKYTKVDAKDTYNLSVMQDNTYLAHNVITHNCYGFQWRHFGAEYVDHKTDYTGQGHDQLQEVIDEIKSNPNSRRLIVSAWNPVQLDEMCLPPCHFAYQFYVAEGKISIIVYQRSADLPLGVPFNIASYALLLHMVSYITGLFPNELIYFTGDNHIYENQLPFVAEQISRQPKPFPTLIMKPGIKKIEDFILDDFIIRDYQHHPDIKYPFTI